MTIIHPEQRRVSTTPNGVMTTYASPTLGDADVSVWTVVMPPGQAGPLHAFDGVQVWTVTAGGATVEFDGTPHGLGPGDTAVVPAGVLRRVTADATQGLEALVVARPGVRASLPDGTDRGVPPWIA